VPVWGDGGISAMTSTTRRHAHMTRAGNRVDLLRVTAKTEGCTVILAVVGQIDIGNSDALAGEIRDALAGGPATIVLDLSRVSFFGSSGLGAVVAADNQARAVGCRLVVMPGTGPVRRLLDQAGAQRLVTIVGEGPPGAA